MYEQSIKEKYDERILRDRAYYETLVIANILEDITLIKEHNINKNNFLSIEYQIVFKALETLSKKGQYSATQIELKACLTDEENRYLIDSDIWRELNNFRKISKADNFNVNIDNLYKNDIYLSLSEMGINLFKNEYIDDKIVVPFELFKGFTANEVKEFYEDKLSSFKTLEAENGLEETIIDFDDEYLLEIENGDLQGTMFDYSGKDVDGNQITAFPIISEETGGIIEGSLSMMAGYSNIGKSTWLVSFVMALIFRGEKVVICSNEQRDKPFKDNFLLWILVNRLGYRGIDKKKLKKGRSMLTVKDLDMIKEAQRIWREDYYGKVKFLTVPDANLDVVKKKFKSYFLKEKYTTYVYDTFKLDFNNLDDIYWLQLIKDSRTLQEFAHRYKVKVIATIQCALSTEGQLFLDSGVISLSKQIKEILENLWIMRRLYSEEKDPEDPCYCRPFTRGESYVNEFGIMVKGIEKVYELSPDKDYRVIFLDKLRAGRTSQDGNYAVVVEFDGATGIFKEVCYCRPKRKNINANQRLNKK